MYMTVGTLIDYLKTQAGKGVSHVYLDADGRNAIRGAIKAQKKAAQPIPVIAPVQEKVPRAPQKRLQPERARPIPEKAPAAVSPETMKLTLPEGSKLDQIQYLKEQGLQWPPAISLQTLRSKMVFSSGSPDTEVVLIGDAPGFDEELKGEPFVGRSGQKLDQILKAMGLNRESIYVTNLCKFRPSLPGQTTNNRKPSAQEMAACMPLVKKELEVIKPKCIIALGATVAESLTRQHNVPVGKMRGEWYEFEGIPVRVTFHPSYLLRNEDNIREKRKLWEDMLTVMEKLEIPISDKQRGFFKS